MLSSGINRLDLAALQGEQKGWTPPPVTATPTPDPAVASASVQPPADGAFVLGQTTRNVTNSRVNIRQTPGHLSKPNGDIVAQMAPGEQVEIIGGPASADNLLWWQVRYRAADGQTVEGWVAEATASGVQILGQ